MQPALISIEADGNEETKGMSEAQNPAIQRDRALGLHSESPDSSADLNSDCAEHRSSRSLADPAAPTKLLDAG